MWYHNRYNKIKTIQYGVEKVINHFNNNKTFKNMKKMKFIMLIAALFVAGISFQACNDKGTSTKATSSKEKTEHMEKQGKEYTSAYVCPMHCEGSGSDQPGNCPKCGMKYKKNDMSGMNHDGHNHEGHEGHNH